ncbi:MAG: 30S ribosome-binding factor RbfA [Firmicutes bacterium]|nr:30S ribosome-binding factor RbfA [Bacillota bacterium]
MITREVGAVNNLRPRRLAEAVKEILAEMLREEIKDPRIGFVTITGIEVTPDLRFAKVYVSVLGEPADKTNCLAGLESAKGFLRRRNGEEVKLRFVPELHFRLDETAEDTQRISGILKKLSEEKKGSS